MTFHFIPLTTFSSVAISKCILGCSLLFGIYFMSFSRTVISCSVLNQLLHIWTITFLSAFNFSWSIQVPTFIYSHAFYAFLIPNVFSNSVLFSPHSQLSSHLCFLFTLESFLFAPFFSSSTVLGGLSLSNPFFTGCEFLYCYSGLYPLFSGSHSFLFLYFHPQFVEVHPKVTFKREYVEYYCSLILKKWHSDLVLFMQYLLEFHQGHF